jgi:hypothetical protein
MLLIADELQGLHHVLRGWAQFATGLFSWCFREFLQELLFAFHELFQTVFFDDALHAFIFIGLGLLEVISQ